MRDLRIGTQGLHRAVALVGDLVSSAVFSLGVPAGQARPPLPLRRAPAQDPPGIPIWAPPWGLSESHDDHLTLR